LARIDAFLKLGTQQGCSDIHLAVGVPPMLRMNGDLVPIKFRDLRDTELESYITEILTPNQQEFFARGNDLDFSYVSAEGGRFRVNVFRKDTGVGATFRSIPSDIPSLVKLGLPPVVTKLCDYHQGMILVTGSTGTGKSTTLAAMIDLLNSHPAPEHHQPRGPDRIRPPQQVEPDHPARARHPHPELRRRRARGDARGSGRDPGR
jgi:twitching motility protein PilT